MANRSKTVSPTPDPPSLDHGDPEAPPLFPQREPSRPTAIFQYIRLCLKCLAAGTNNLWTRIIDHHLFMAAFFVYGFFVMLVALLSKKYFNENVRFGADAVPYGGSGVGFPCVPLSQLSLSD